MHPRFCFFYPRMPQVSAYFLAKNLSEMAIQLISPVVFSCVVYPLVGLQPGADKFFMFMVMNSNSFFFFFERDQGPQSEIILMSSFSFFFPFSDLLICSSS
jgi:hypothetical protein